MWKYMSCDFENISLHDYSIDEILLDDNDILLVFDDGFHVAETHPLNDTGKSKHTTTSQIILRSANFIKGTIYHWRWQEKKSRSEKIELMWLINSFRGFSILQFEAENGAFSLHGDMYLYEPEFKQEYAEIKFSCSDAVFCWNDYSSDA